MTLAELIERVTSKAHIEMDRSERCLDEHGYGCARAECGRRVVRPGELQGLSSFIPKETK